MSLLEWSQSKLISNVHYESYWIKTFFSINILFAKDILTKMKLIKYTHGIFFLMVKNIHKIPVATVTLVVAISLSRPTRLDLALDNPAMKINTRPTSNFGTCRILPCILAFLRAFLCNNYCVEKNVFNQKNDMQVTQN